MILRVPCLAECSAVSSIEILALIFSAEEVE